MRLLELLKSPVTSLPKEREGIDFLDFLEDVFDKFFRHLSELDVTGDITEKIHLNVDNSRILADSIISSITRYYDGHPGEAYEVLKNGILRVHPHIRSLVAESASAAYFKNLYRIRIKEDKTITREGMFHIPFQLRHLVRSQRYSIPGFPSLYLGSSIYIAWREMGCPDLNNVIVSRVEANEDIKILDFGYVPQYEPEVIANLENYTVGADVLSEMFLARIVCWPLMAACSVKVEHKKSPFKPEYIIPQILLQLIRNDVFGEDIDGIRYFSMNTGNDIPSLRIHNNFVFPVKVNNLSGHCETLKRKFKLTEPASWQLLNSIYEEPDYIHTPDGFIQLVKGINTRYRSTDFAKIEARLTEIPAREL